ncbi:MAG: hypothetical protein GX222_06855 [Ruminococcaceae bacterium]|nr:hypothetical protein [Oscillospiraceae bacterium]
MIDFALLDIATTPDDIIRPFSSNYPTLFLFLVVGLVFTAVIALSIILIILAVRKKKNKNQNIQNNG